MEPTKIEIASLYGAQTKQGLVELSLDDKKVQMTLDKAREVLGMLSSAIEAAVSDELLVKFLTTKIGLYEEAAARSLISFRELRQGSKTAVYAN